MTAPLRWLGRFGLFLGDVLRGAWHDPPGPAAILHEGHRIGVRSLPILLVISFFVGTNLAIQGWTAFRPMGAQGLLGMFVALAGVRELAPIMVAAMVAAKAGTEMASNIAVMRTDEQIDALVVMAVDPYGWLVAPRFLGILLVLPALTVLSVFTVLASGLLVTVVQLGEPGHTFVQLAQATTTMRDLAVCGVKAVVFGTLICTISCFCGFEAERGAKGVGAATNAAVVLSAVGCAMINYVVSAAFYG
jgi:phospholipid/cholesterol/gamma-HCH transport system permease protein